MSQRDHELARHGEAATGDTQQEAPAPSPSSINPILQRKIQRRILQRRAEGKTSEDAASLHAAAERGVTGAASSLPHLEQIQTAFGRHDVSGVQAHVGGAAAEASEAIGAQAYATGNHVAFGNAPDLHTAAHEAAHVVQQRAGVHLKDGTGQAGDAYEAHADAVADKVVRGESAEALLDQHTGGGASSAVQRKTSIVDDKSDKKNQTQPGQGRGLLKETDGHVNPYVKFGGLRDGCATSMECVVTPVDDLDGTEPKEGTWPPWWQAAAPNPNRYWVRGNLLNRKLGGPGEPRNLTPITKSCNTQHYLLVESWCKDAIAQHALLEYKVTPIYDGAGPTRLPGDAKDPQKSVWPKIAKGLTCEARFLSHDGKVLGQVHAVTILNDRD